MKTKIISKITIIILLFFASCSSGTSGKYESNCFKVQTIKYTGYINYKIVTYEDSVKMKKYTILVCSKNSGIGCTLIDTEEIK